MSNTVYNRAEENLSAKDKPRVLALGMFDGVHKGHQSLLREAIRIANIKGTVASVYTFTNHPMTLFGKKPEYLTSIDERDALLLDNGMQEVLTDPFDAALSHMEPEAFLEMLVTRFHAVGLVAGYNYTFGRGAEGTPKQLLAWGEAHGITVSVMPEVRYGSRPVSSSVIRSLLTEEGDTETAGALLTRPYTLKGEVIHGRENGRKMHFPTANLNHACFKNRVLPLTGVYATLATVDGATYPAVTNIGKNPTFGATDTTVETHIIGEVGDCYGKTISVGFKKRLRGEITFASADELKAQITKDILAAGEENSR